jgi:sodium transport system permease protein
MYAAVDTTAGEKERRTIEMLLASAAAREEIVTAKVALSLTSAATNAVLSLLSYVVAFRLTQSRSSGPQAFNFVFPSDPVTLGLIVLLILPISILAAAIAIAAATPAKSSREAMSYLTPGMFVVMTLGMVTFVPQLQTNMWLALLPFANFSAMLRQVLLGEWSWAQYGLTVAANLTYAAGATALAVRSFRNEKVLFRT